MARSVRFFVVLYCFLALVLYEIPFVDHYNETFFVTLYEREYRDVLCFDAACGIDHEQAYIGGFDSPDGADHGVVFDVFVDFVFLAYAGGVDEVEIESEFVVSCVYGVTCGSGYVGDYVTLLFHK